MAEEVEIEARTQKEATFPIVCIGMSAGAVRPLEQLFDGLSPNTGMAFILTHHLHNIPTMLPEILKGITKMPVEMATEGLTLERNHIYILPSGQELTLKDGYFALGPRTKFWEWTNMFTLLLESLAKSRRQAIAVILSGLDEDGSAALGKFSAAGGITIVQAPKSVTYQGMPEAVIRTGYVDHVLAPGNIAAELERIAMNLRDGNVRSAAAPGAAI